MNNEELTPLGFIGSLESIGETGDTAANNQEIVSIRMGEGTFNFREEEAVRISAFPEQMDRGCLERCKHLTAWVQFQTFKRLVGN